MLSDEPEVPEPRVELYGLKVAGDKPVSIAPHLTDDDGSSVSLHLTQVALGAKPASGPHTLFAKVGGSQFAVGTLEMGRCEQFSVDYMLTTDASFSHSGSSEVFLTGYRCAHRASRRACVPDPASTFFCVSSSSVCCFRQAYIAAVGQHGWHGRLQRGRRR